MSSSLLDYFNHTLLNDIQLARHLGVRAVRHDGRSLLLTAPISANLNDKTTAFAGSLYSVCTLSGWGLLSLILKEAGIKADVAIYKSDINYYKPVRQDIQCLCALPTTETVEQLLAALHANNKAKIQLTAEIQENGTKTVEFNGKYVVLGKDI